MRIRIIKNTDVNLDKPRLGEIWPKYLFQYDEYDISQVETLSESFANLVLENGDVLLEVPIGSFQLQTA